MRRSLTLEEQDLGDDEVEPTTAQRSFAYICYVCYGRVLELIGESSKLDSVKLCLDGELREDEEENQMEHPLPVHVQALLDKVGSERMRTRLVAIRNRNWDRLLTLREWAESLSCEALRKLSFVVTLAEDLQILSGFLGRQKSLRIIKVSIDRWNFLQNQNVLGNILKSICCPENVEALTISHHFQTPLDFQATFEDFTNLKFIKLHNNDLDLRGFRRHTTPIANPTVVLRDGFMAKQVSPSLGNLVNYSLTSIEVIDFKDFSISPLEMRQILELPMLRKLKLRVKIYTVGYKGIGLYSSDLVKAMLTMRKLEHVLVEPVIFRREKSLNIEVMSFGSSGSICVPDDCQFLKSVGKLLLETDFGCSVYSGKYASPNTSK